MSVWELMPEKVRPVVQQPSSRSGGRYGHCYDAGAGARHGSSRPAARALQAAVVAAFAVLFVGCAKPSPRVAVAPDMAEQAVAALQLWERATDGEFSADVVVSSDCDGASWCFVSVESLPGCADFSEPFACTTAGSWMITDWTGFVAGATTRLDRTRTPPEWWVSTLAHEIGHQLGLEHSGSGGLMDPARGDAARAVPCVEASALDAAGFSGEGACL